MKICLIMFLLILSPLALSEGYTPEITRPPELICASMRSNFGKSVALSCVSKASIEKDKAELEKIMLEKQILEVQLKKIKK